MKVFITSTATFEEARGGAARYLSGLRAGLEASGATVVVRTSHGLLGPAAKQAGMTGQIARVVLRVFKVFPQIVLAIVRERPDVVTSHFPLEGLAALLGARLVRRPLVSHFHGPWALEAAATERRGSWPLSTRLRRYLEVLVYRGSSEIVTLSEAFATILHEELGVDRGRIVVIPGGLDMAEWRVADDRESARRALGVGDAFTVLSVRRLVRRMGLDIALHAVAAWDLDRPVKLLIIGEGEERRELEALAANLALDGRVEFLGGVSDIDLRRAYTAADVTLMPTRSLEGFGYAALESMAIGTPVIGTAVGGLAELVGGLSADLLVAPDADAMADRLEDICQRPWAYPGRTDCRAYANQFAWSVIVDRVLDVYRTTAASRLGGGGA